MIDGPRLRPDPWVATMPARRCGGCPQLRNTALPGGLFVRQHQEHQQHTNKPDRYTQFAQLLADNIVLTFMSRAYGIANADANAEANADANERNKQMAAPTPTARSNLGRVNHNGATYAVGRPRVLRPAGPTHLYRAARAGGVRVWSDDPVATIQSRWRPTTGRRHLLRRLQRKYVREALQAKARVTHAPDTRAATLVTAMNRVRSKGRPIPQPQLRTLPKAMCLSQRCVRYPTAPRQPVVNPGTVGSITQNQKSGL
jgi:hypothetical protein